MTTRLAAILLAVAFVVVWVLGGVWYAQLAPSSMMEANSRGTGWIGQRGLFDLLARLGTEVSRDYGPLPGKSGAGAPTRAYLGSNPYLVGQNLGFVDELRAWVQKGGVAIVADESRDVDVDIHVGLEEARPMSAALLGKDALAVELVEVGTVPSARRMAHSLIPQPDGAIETFAQNLLRLDSRSMDVAAVAIVGEGVLRPLAREHPEIVVPRIGLQVFTKLPGDDLLGAIGLADRPGNSIAAIYQVGKGRVLIVSDSRLVMNGLLQYSGVGAFLVDLISATGPVDRLVFDHFFLGEAVLGNPAWLLGRFPYNVFAACLLAVSILVPWRLAGRLGPPEPDPPPHQPGLAEQLTTVANLMRDRRHFHDSVDRLASGVIWRLRTEFGIRRSSGGLNALMAAIERRDPERAARLRNVLEMVRQPRQRPLSDKDVVQIGKELVRCLSKKSSNG